MKTRRLSTILTSAYLSAMLASNVAPVRSDATLAAIIDPMAARTALQSALSGIDSAGWMTASTAASVTIPPAANAAPINPPPATNPVMTEELMARLIIYTRAGVKTGSLAARMCKVLDLCDGTTAMPLKLNKSDTATDGGHYFGIPPKADSTDILLVVKHETTMVAYLTDKTWKLRAAAVIENDTTHLITNEKAGEGFQKELSLFAGEASSLPPTGTSLAGNS